MTVACRVAENNQLSREICRFVISREVSGTVWKGEGNYCRVGFEPRTVQIPEITGVGKNFGGVYGGHRSRLEQPKER